MKLLRVILLSWIPLAFTFGAEDLPVFNPEDLVDGKVDSAPVLKEETKPEKVIEYTAFINEISRLRKSSNKLRAEYDIKQLSDQAMNQVFLFRDTVRVKRNVLVSGEIGCWFEPMKDFEVFLKFPEDMIEDFINLEEHDYVTCYSRLVDYKGRMIFLVEKLIAIEPFDPTAEFLEYNQKVDDFEKMKGELEYFKYKDALHQFSVLNEGRLGIMTGKMISLTRDSNTNEVVMKMDYGELPVEIICHPDYLEVLLDLRFNSRISMAVILKSIDPRKGYRFSRGCMVQLREAKASNDSAE